MTLIEMVEAAHDECSGYEGCGCFARLLALIRGEPDPQGVGYQWPVLRYGCEEPPEYGPETLEQHMVRRLTANLVESYYGGLAVLVPPSTKLTGLSHWLSKGQP